MARATEGGTAGAAPENAAAAAAGTEAAADAPTVAPGDAPQSQTVAADGPVAAGDASASNVETVGNATAVVPGVDTDPEGEASLAQKVALHDAALRQENPDAIVYREAGSAGEVGGESFTYGQKPEADESE